MRIAHGQSPAGAAATVLRGARRPCDTASMNRKRVPGTDIGRGGRDVIAVAGKHDDFGIGDARGMPLHGRDRLQAAFLRRHHQGGNADARQHGVEIHVDARRGGAVGGAHIGLAHEFFGPPSHLRLRRVAAEPGTLGLRRPLPHAVGADGIGIAAAAAAERRPEQAQRRKAMGAVGGELHAGRAAIFGADQVAPPDGESIEKPPDIGREFAGAPAVSRRLGGGAEARQIGTQDPVSAGEVGNPSAPGPRGLRVAVDHHHGLGRGPGRTEPMVLIGHPHAGPDLGLLHRLSSRGRPASRAHPAVLL